MSQMIRKVAKVSIFAVFIFTIVGLISYSYIVKNNAVVKKLKDKGYVSFSVLLYGTEKIFPERLDAYIFLYDKETNILKILSINSDVVVFEAKEKSKSLKARFSENLKKGTSTAVKNFYCDLRKIIGNTAVTDFYVNMSFEMFNIITERDKKLRLILSRYNFKDKNLESLNRFETVERILYLMSCKIINILINRNSFDTNISRLSFVLSLLGFRSLKPEIMFSEMPVKYAYMSVKPDRQNIKEFLNKVYCANSVSQANENDILVDVKNASQKPHVAEKTAWLLRENNFDVLDWSNFSGNYDRTLIRDYKGNFIQALKIAKVLGTGKVVVSYDNKICSDISVFLGNDYTTCDNLGIKGN